ncbi:MAG TPA: response regulator [Opitutaceae bacterium]|nr:response regulator [Opitutaceae bacterium]HLP08588.1 response regulator [Opitutaceae bacterium]
MTPTENSAPAKKVLIVDDEKSFTELLAQILNDNMTCAVESYNRPADALKAIQAGQVAVLVTDYYMPVMNGIELIRNLQQAQPSVPAILITGHSLKFGEEEMRRLPALKAVLAKPFGWRKLADLLIQHWPDEHPPKIKDLA